MKSGENGLIGPGDNNYGRGDKKPKALPVTPDIPRRIRLDLCIPAELAITNAIQEIEKIGADVRLTNAEVLLQQAKNLVSDYIDEKPEMQKDAMEKIKPEVGKRYLIKTGFGSLTARTCIEVAKSAVCFRYDNGNIDWYEYQDFEIIEELENESIKETNPDVPKKP